MLLPNVNEFFIRISPRFSHSRLSRRQVSSFPLHSPPPALKPLLHAGEKEQCKHAHFRRGRKCTGCPPDRVWSDARHLHLTIRLQTAPSDADAPARVTCPKYFQPISAHLAGGGIHDPSELSTDTATSGVSFASRGVPQRCPNNNTTLTRSGTWSPYLQGIKKQRTCTSETKKVPHSW